MEWKKIYEVQAQTFIITLWPSSYKSYKNAYSQCLYLKWAS